MVWPDPIDRPWENIDRLPNAAAQMQAAAIYKRLARMDAESPLLFRFNDNLLFRFNDNAQELFNAWHTDLERRIRSPGTGEIMKAHLAKYRKLMPALSLLYALSDGALETCSLRHAQQAAEMCEYLETHAVRVYSAQASPEQTAARALGQKIAGGLLARPLFHLRDLYRKCWSGLTSRDEARAALRTLEDLNWVRVMAAPEGRNGRPSETYAINPFIEAHHADR